MTLNHSKTWPVSTLAVVQLRVDPQRKTYSTVTDTDLEIPPLSEAGPFVANGCYFSPFLNSNGIDLLEKVNQNLHENPLTGILEEIKETHVLIQGVGDNEKTANGSVLPLSKRHLEIFTKMSTMHKTTIRTDTISTLLDPTEFESEKQEDGERTFVTQEKQDEKIAAKSQEEDGTCELQKYHVLALTRIDENVNESDCVVHGIGRRPSIKVDNWDFIYTETLPIKTQNRCPIHCYNPSADPNHTKDGILPDLPLDARKTTTLRRHYYPEGGWGWVVIVCSVLVHVLNHGVQLACSQLVIPGSKKFKVDAVHFSGESIFSAKVVAQ